MDQGLRGLTQVQENDCRAVLAMFIERHDLSDWGSTVNVEEKTPGQFFVKIELTPPEKSGLAEWPVDEIAVSDGSADVATEVDKLLEAGFQVRLLDAKVLEKQ